MTPEEHLEKAEALLTLRVRSQSEETSAATAHAMMALAAAQIETNIQLSAIASLLRGVL